MQIRTAMILAAGEGRRMRPLTLTTPKPLLVAGDKPLIEHHICKLVAAGITRIVINLAYLGSKIEQALGCGERFGAQLLYSYEPNPLETAGAINHALDLLGSEPFLLVNGDIYTDLDFNLLCATPLPANMLGRLVLVANPSHNPSGDFEVLADGLLAAKGAGGEAATFSGVSILAPELIRTYPQCRETFPLKEVFDYGIKRGVLQGQIYSGWWTDVGTPERLAQINAQLNK